MTRGMITGLLFGVAAAAGGGCQSKPGESFVPVEGTVTQEGKPLADVVVEFIPESGRMELRSQGTTDANGHYRLRGLHGEDGALAGPHRVCIYDAPILTGEPPPPPSPGKGPEQLAKWVAKAKHERSASPPRVPRRYRTTDKTPLRFEVRPEQPVIDLEVKGIGNRG